MSKPMQLIAQQRAMQDLIVGSEQAGPLVVADADERAERLHIYQTAYRLRLQDALASNFPMLQTHLGADVFDVVANEYIQVHPSTHVSIRHIGSRLADWLDEHRCAEPWLAEFARFEWALAHAFDAPDTTKVRIDELAAVEPAHWPALQFRFAPATQRLSALTNAPELYRVAANETSTAQGETADGSEWLIWRCDLTAQYRSLTKSEADALDTLLAGGTFGDACEAMLDHAQADVMAAEAASFLKRWLTDELISSFSLAPAP